MDRTKAPRIGIVGGGPAGLVLAGVLAMGGTAATVLERDAGEGARSQGGSLDLHPDSGQRALLAAGLMDPFLQHARPQGEEIRILDPEGREHARHRGDPAPTALVPDAEGTLPGRPEIDRAVLRRLLLESLPDGTVRWGCHVTEVAPRPGGGHRAVLADGTIDEYDLLVGADGARSRVRPLLTAAEPQPVGVATALLRVPDIARHPRLDRLIGGGSLWCLGRDLVVTAQRGGAGDARVSVLHRPAADGPRIRAGASKRDLIALLSGWSPRITGLVAAADDDVQVYELMALPVDLTWAPRGDLSLIGDAAHLMPPVGEGANQAMLDAAELGRAILAAGDEPGALAAAVAAAEAAMFARIRPIAEESARLQSVIVSPDALATMTRMFGG